jgi:hypothetical protein
MGITSIQFSPAATAAAFVSQPVPQNIAAGGSQPLWGSVNPSWVELNPQPLPPKEGGQRFADAYDDFCGTRPTPWPNPHQFSLGLDSAAMAFSGALQIRA